MVARSIEYCILPYFRNTSEHQHEVKSPNFFLDQRRRCRPRGLFRVARFICWSEAMAIVSEVTNHSWIFFATASIVILSQYEYQQAILNVMTTLHAWFANTLGRITGSSYRWRGQALTIPATPLWRTQVDLDHCFHSLSNRPFKSFSHRRPWYVAHQTYRCRRRVSSNIPVA